MVSTKMLASIIVSLALLSLKALFLRKLERIQKASMTPDVLTNLLYDFR